MQAEICQDSLHYLVEKLYIARQRNIAFDNETVIVEGEAANWVGLSGSCEAETNPLSAASDILCLRQPFSIYAFFDFPQ